MYGFPPATCTRSYRSYRSGIYCICLAGLDDEVGIYRTDSLSEVCNFFLFERPKTKRSLDAPRKAGLLLIASVVETVAETAVETKDAVLPAGDRGLAL